MVWSIKKVIVLNVFCSFLINPVIGAVSFFYNYYTYKSKYTYLVKYNKNYQTPLILADDVNKAIENK